MYEENVSDKKGGYEDMAWAVWLGLKRILAGFFSQKSPKLLNLK